MLRDAARLSRLSLAVVFLFVWSVSTGARIIHKGRHYLVDRKDRRDLSIFQVGLRFIEHQLINSLPFPRCLCTYR